MWSSLICHTERQLELKVLNGKQTGTLKQEMDKTELHMRTMTLMAE